MKTAWSRERCLPGPESLLEPLRSLTHLQGDDAAREANCRGNNVERGPQHRKDGSRKRQLSDEESKLSDREGLGLGISGADRGALHD